MRFCRTDMVEREPNGGGVEDMATMPAKGHLWSEVQDCAAATGARSHKTS